MKYLRSFFPAMSLMIVLITFSPGYLVSGGEGLTGNSNNYNVKNTQDAPEEIRSEA